MATNTSSLFTALVGAELRVWNSLEAALTEAETPCHWAAFWSYARSETPGPAASRRWRRARASRWAQPRASWIVCIVTVCCTVRPASTTAAPSS